ncbi:unnamed protein product, partial [Closterium sp. NIES-53]
VAASSQVLAAASGSGPESAPCSCRLLSHQTLLWHHRLGHPSLPRLRGMASRVLVSSLPRSLPLLPLGPAPTCVPFVEGRQRAAPHSSEFPPTEAPLQTLHMDVWGPARVRGQGHERYFLLVVDDYSRYTTVFPFRSKGQVTEVLIDWIRAARLRLRESFRSDFPVLRLHSDRGGEFSSALLGAFCRAQGIRQIFTLPASPQQNGIAERRIGMIGLLKLMIGEEPRPSDPALQEDWDERASAGYYLMSQSLELNQHHHVMHLLPEVDCGPKAWTVLKELHAPTSVVATLMLERELSALRLSEGEPVQPVLDKMRDLYAKLATVGITYPEQTKCLKMLSLLPESWLQFTSGLSLPQNQSLLTLEWVRTKILEEDFRRRQLRGGDDGSSGYGMQGSKRG